MDYSKFYTPPEIAYFLVKQLKVPIPSEIVDICCGSCNLLRAAGKRWPKSKLTGVDIVVQESTDIVCIKSDGRDFALKHSGEYPLVLANPPFDFVNSKREFPELFDNIPSNCNTSRLEVEMLFANLRILKQNGTLMIIVPSTFVTAEGYRRIRKYLSMNYHIQKIMYLPDDTFGSSNISSCALVIKRENPYRRHTYCLSVTHSGSKYNVSKEIIIPQVKMRLGDWNTFFVNKLKNTFNFRRGNISSKYFVKNGTAMLHTARIANPWEPSVRYISVPPRNAVYAETGDIVISRVGKSAGQWHKYEGPRILISDCLYVLRDTDGDIFKRINGKQYPYPLKGVSTRYITISDFAAWLYSLC